MRAENRHKYVTQLSRYSRVDSTFMRPGIYPVKKKYHLRDQQRARVDSLNEQTLRKVSMGGQRARQDTAAVGRCLVAAE